LSSLAGIGYLAYRAFNQVHPSSVLERAVEDIANGQFRHPVPDNSYWGNALNMIRSRLGEAHARLYDTVEKETKARLLVELAHEQTQFLSNMSHELRTPLMGMMTTSQQLWQGLSGTSHRQQAQMLHTSSHQLSNVIYNLLDYTCLQTGQLRLKPNDFRLQNWLCAEVLLTHLPTIKDKELGYRLLVKEGIPVMLHADQVRLSQVLNNLLSNAVKFTDTGEIVVTLQRGEVYHNQLVELKISVSDTGCGMSREQLSRLFLPFSQTHQSENTQAKGAGLGLVVTRLLVQMMQGEISIQSQPEKGTVVNLSLLLPQVGEAVMPKLSRDLLLVIDQNCGVKVSSDKPFEGMRVAIVEDNLINQAVIISLLKKLGIDQIKVFNHGRDFIESADQAEFDVVLIDCLMPVMDGYETTRQWRKRELEKRNYHRPLPIIALTANAVMGDEDACYAAGMNDYLTKPVSLEMLRSCLLRHWLP
jgi:signal transduction histidine kinase/CheY-like chemotaxis protein